MSVWYNTINYHIWKCICKKYSSNTLPHVSHPNWSINVVARHPLGCLPCFGSQRSGWETVSFLLLQQWPLNCTLASLSRHPSLFFPAPFTPHCLHYLNTWNRLLSPILWWIWVSQLKRNEFKSGVCLYAPSPHALQKGKIVGNAIFNILGINETRLSSRFIVIVILWRIPKLGIKFVVLVSLSPLSLITVSLLDGINRQSLR